MTTADKPATSEVRWFAGCIGMAGETSRVKLARAISAFGHGRDICFGVDEKTDAAFTRIFGCTPAELDKPR